MKHFGDRGIEERVRGRRRLACRLLVGFLGMMLLILPISSMAERSPIWDLAVQGRQALKEKDPVRAEALFSQALSAYREIGQPEGIALTTAFLGTAARARGDLTRAEKFYREGYDLARKIPYPFGAAYAAGGLARVRGDRDDLLGEAPDWHRRAIEHYGQMGKPQHGRIGAELHALTQVQARMGDLPAACRSMRVAIRRFEQGEHVKFAARSRAWRDRNDCARHLMPDDVRRRFGDAGPGPEEVETLIDEGLAAMNRGAEQQAEDILRWVTDFAPDQTGAWGGLAVLLDGQGRRQEALPIYRRVREMGQETGQKHVVAMAAGAIGRLLMDEQATAKALPALQQAVTLHGELQDWPAVGKYAAKLAVAHLRLRRGADAVAAARIAVDAYHRGDLAEEAAAPLLTIAQSFQSIGDEIGALIAYREILKLPAGATRRPGQPDPALIRTLAHTGLAQLHFHWKEKAAACTQYALAQQTSAAIDGRDGLKRQLRQMVTQAGCIE